MTCALIFQPVRDLPGLLYLPKKAGGEAGEPHRPYLPTEGGVFPSKGSGGASQPHAAGKILADPMGHERTAEAHH